MCGDPPSAYPRIVAPVALPTCWRARLAVAVVAMVVVLVAADGAVGPGAVVGSPLTLLVAAAAGYLLGAWTPVPTALAGVLVADLALTFANQQHFPGEHSVIDDAAFFLLVLGAPAVAGASLVARADQVRDLEALSVRRCAQRADDLAAARLEEQHRIELEVYHRLVEQLGAVALRADGARHEVSAIARDQALLAVEATARSALDELRHALGRLGAAPGAGPAGDGLDGGHEQEPPPGWRDLALAGGLGAAMAVEAVAGAGARGPALGNILAAFAVAAPLVVRRQRPVLAAAGVLALGAAMGTVLTPSSVMVTSIAVVLLASYAVGCHARGWRRLAGTGVVWAGALVVAAAEASAGRDADWLVPLVLWSGLAVVAGAIVAGWVERAARMRELVAELERHRDAERRVAVARKREEMARNLHDSAAHALTVVCLSAGGARRVGAAAVDEALEVIVSTSRAGMAELRRGLDALTPFEDSARAVQAMRALGENLGVCLRVEAPNDLSLDASSALLLHRLLREAVVNAARYAPGTSVVARFEQGAGQVTLEVTDDGQVASPVALGAGTGLSGLAAQLRERGGRLDHGRLAGGGYRVAAMLPTSVAAPP